MAAPAGRLEANRWIYDRSRMPEVYHGRLLCGGECPVLCDNGGEWNLFPKTVSLERVILCFVLAPPRSALPAVHWDARRRELEGK